jgi:hypothetical protein
MFLRATTTIVGVGGGIFLRWAVFVVCMGVLYWMWRSIRYVCPPKPDKTYPIRLDEIDTGDLIICAGNAYTSLPIRTFSQSPWTHVGIAVRTSPSQIYILHADVVNNCRNHLPSGRKRGVQLNDLQEYITNYPGHIFVRPISEDKHHQPDSKRLLDLVRLEYDGADFQKSTIRMMRSVGGRRPLIMTINHTGRRAYFCSEFVADLLKRLEILVKDAPSHLYHPVSFAPESDDDANIGLQYRLSEYKELYVPFLRYLATGPK